ncbi:hypothetical protein BOX37_05870 [Nocardia mangyaensis]|uniref:UspA domain-containing protein n=1 Tax=Nocardia mangyaensis TaxID=2213200 RepID=A0A1J0VNI1_9NOCA|nr:universal stress protein [Nocardia mangyaensis]APE33574.1 hypothetical protein BOX37_05870 [Nocardia mangyaensis]
MHTYRTIVVDTDGFEGSDLTVATAASIAAVANARLIMVRIYSVRHSADDDALADVLGREAHLLRGIYPAEDTLRAAADRAAACGAIDIVGRAIEGEVTDALLGVANETGADLLVIPEYGRRSALARLLGTLPDELGRRTRAAVIAVHQDNAESPRNNGRTNSARTLHTAPTMTTSLRSRLLARFGVVPA